MSESGSEPWTGGDSRDRTPRSIHWSWRSTTQATPCARRRWCLIERHWAVAQEAEPAAE